MTASAQTPELAARIAVDDEPAGAAARVVEDAGALPAFKVPLAVRIVFQGVAGDPALALRLAAFDKRHAPVWLSLPAPVAKEDIEPWRVALRGLLEKPDAAAGDPARVVDGVLHDLGTEVVMHAWRASDVNGVALRAVASLTDLLTHEISILDDAGVGLELRVGPKDVTQSLPHRVLFDE